MTHRKFFGVHVEIIFQTISKLIKQIVSEVIIIYHSLIPNLLITDNNLLHDKKYSNDIILLNLNK